MIFGTDDLISDLRALGVESGDGLFVHSALSAVGSVVGGPRGLIEALIGAVGDEGLIAMPGFSRDAYDPADLLDAPVAEEDRARLRAQVPGYDPRLSNVSQNGATPEAFRSWPGVVRSAHPTSSVLLLGPDAAALSTPHDPLGWPTGVDTPWSRLSARPRMKILLIGVGWNRCSALHAAESAAPHKRTTTRRFLHDDGDGASWVEAPDVADDDGRLFPLVGAAWERTGGVTTGLIGKAESRLCGYGELAAFAASWLNERNQADGVAAA